MMVAHEKNRLESAMAVDEKTLEPDQGAYIIEPTGMQYKICFKIVLKPADILYAAASLVYLLNFLKIF